MHYRYALRPLGVLLLIAGVACSPALGTFVPATPSPAPTEVPPTSPPPSATIPPPSPTVTSTVEPSATVGPSPTPLATPGAPKSGGEVINDVVSSGTGPEHRAPYGDSYDLNLFERPFAQADMTDLPNVDIASAHLTTDGTWYYVAITLVGTDPNDPLGVDYGIELNKNADGFGDTLLWAAPPYTTSWSQAALRVYTDPNRDTGGASAEKSDAKPGAPLPGDGYETIIFKNGLGNDPDLAWVRIDPKKPSVIEFAFKVSLAGTKFMWGAWADAGLKDPTKFNYNDRFTAAEAGSPLDNNPNYPLKALYAVDDTCWAAHGFVPLGDEPRLCPTP